jgi:hypothetical protein
MNKQIRLLIENITDDLFKDDNNIFNNNDVYDIMRKYLKCNCDEIISLADEGFVVNPVKVKF